MNFKKLLFNQYLTWKYAAGRTKKYWNGKEKSKAEIVKDLIEWQFRESEFNWLYYAMGLNITGSKQNNFIGRKTFLRIKNKVEKKLRADANVSCLNYDVITKDKFYLTSILSQNSIPCIKNIAVIVRGKLVTSNNTELPLNELINIDKEFVLKNITLESSEGVLTCEVVNSKVKTVDSLLNIDELKKKLGQSIWVVQKKHYSHAAIQKINNSALNTTRIVTILSSNSPEYLTGFQGIATNNAVTDSWSNGAVYVGIIPEKDSLKSEAFTSPSDHREGVLKYHPDSKVEFKGYNIPYLSEAVKLCIKAHKLLYFNFIIGWDVAITNDGPFILEANEKPGMNVVQCIDGGLREKILIYSKNILTKNFN